MKNVLDVTQLDYDRSKFRVVLFNKNEEDVTVDFSSYGISKGTHFIIRDVEDYSNVLKSGVLGKDKEITFPMKMNKGDKNKTLDNFGVYIIEFSELDIEKKSFFEKVFGCCSSRFF